MKKFLTVMLLALAVLARAQVPFVGPGVNTHAQLLPVASLRAIGIRWVRADLPVGKTTEAKAREIVEWYAPLPVLWMMDSREPDPIGLARKLTRAGVDDIEIVNEPDGTWFRQMEPEAVADLATRLRISLPASVRLYGPSTAAWLPDYIGRFMARLSDPRMVLAAVSVHLYLKRAEDCPSTVIDVGKRWGLPVVCTEVGSHSLATNPEKRKGAALFVALRDAYGLIPWCWYDGPNANADKTAGLYDYVDGKWVPTATYNAILKATQATEVKKG